MSELDTDRYVAHVLKANLLKTAELEAVLAALPPAGAVPGPERVRRLRQELLARKWLTPWQDEVLAGGVPREFFLGNRKLLELLPRGGAVKTYVAEAAAGRKCLLRIYPQERLRDPVSRGEFLAEIRRRQAVEHPGLMKTLSLEASDAATYQVLEHQPGSDLAGVIADAGSLPPSAVLKIVAPVAETLNFLHGQGIVHHRLRPALLRLGAGGSIKLTDLDAYLFEPLPSEPVHGRTPDPAALDLQSAAYLAPEEWTGTGGPAADRYGLGAILFFLLTGRPPFVGATAGELKDRIRNAPTPNPLDVRPDVPEALAHFCRRLLAKVPEERPVPRFEIPPPSSIGRAVPVDEPPDEVDLDQAAAEAEAARNAEERLPKLLLKVVLGAAAAGLLLGGGIWAVMRNSAASVAENGSDRSPQARPTLVRDDAAAEKLWRAGRPESTSGESLPTVAAPKLDIPEDIYRRVFPDDADRPKLLIDRKGLVVQDPARNLPYVSTPILRIDRGEAGGPQLPGLSFDIRENPKHDEARCLTFAFSCEGDGPFGVELALDGKFVNDRPKTCFYWGDPPPPGISARKLGDVRTGRYEHVLDLFAERGEFRLTGLRFLAPNGTLRVDNVFLTRSYTEAMMCGLPQHAVIVCRNAFKSIRDDGGKIRGIPFATLCGRDGPAPKRQPGFELRPGDARRAGQWTGAWNHAFVGLEGVPTLDLELKIPAWFSGYLVLHSVDGAGRNRRQRAFVGGRELETIDDFDGSGKSTIARILPADMQGEILKLRLEALGNAPPVVSLIALVTAPLGD